MTQRGDRSGLAFESFSKARFLCDARVKHLERHGAAKSRIACFVDLPHSAFAKFREDFIRAEFLPDHVLASPATASLRSTLTRDERRAMART
jgi:hypothetical protein